MSADSLRASNMSNRVPMTTQLPTTGNHNYSHHEHERRSSGGMIIRPQPVSEKTLMESVAGFINEVGLVPQPYSTNEEKENNIVWTKFENVKESFDLNASKMKGNDYFSSSSQHTPHRHYPLLLTLAYPSGIQMWIVGINGEAQEVLSWRRPAIRFSKLLSNPVTDPDLIERDYAHAGSRPIVAIVEGHVSPTSPNHLTFISLRSGEIVKTTKFIHPVCDLLANSVAIIVTFLDKILILDPFTLETRTSIPCSSGNLTSSPLLLNPIALGCSWLAFADRKLLPHYQSVGGVELAGVPSYTATVLYAAKSLTKGLKGLGETVANITGHRLSNPLEPSSSSIIEPGVVTIVNLSELKNVTSDAFGHLTANELLFSNSACVAHFVAHTSSPVQAMKFDPAGLLLVTADREGHDFHVFRIHPHPLGSHLGSVHHLYVLHRGDTGAKVQDISYSPDSRWVAVSTLRGTSHIFPITPYGGSISVRTHTSHRVVNRLSRFHRTAGLDDNPTSGRNSPVLSFSPGGVIMSGSGVGSILSVGRPYDLLHFGSPYPNSRLPPFPHPLIIQPLAQLRQNFHLPSSSPKNSPPITKSKGLLAEERIHVVSSFDSPRSWLLTTPPILHQQQQHCDKRKKSPVEALYVMTCHGNLIEYFLEPRPASGIPKEKISDDSAVELFVHARAQWNFTRPSFAKDLHPPLSSNNIIIANSSYLSSSVRLNNSSGNGNTFESSGRSSGEGKGGDESPDEKWLAHVEITTHSGPHRRLWMGPQFTFKVFNPTGLSSGNPSCLVDIETVEVNVTNRPAKSDPVNMPISSSLLPVVIEGSSGSSLEQSPRLLDPYSDSDTSVIPSELNIKESLADAMMEGCGISSRDTGGCQSLGSCDDLSSSSFDSTSQHSIDVPFVPTFYIETTLPFPD